MSTRAASTDSAGTTSARSDCARSRRRKAWALAWGVLNHAAFVWAIATMFWQLHEGLRAGRGGLTGTDAWLANALLVAQFPLLHSFLLSTAGRRVLARLGPADLGRDLAPTTFTLIASLQTWATFHWWSPSGLVLYEPHGPLRWIFELAFAASWLLLVVALRDAGLRTQTGAVGWLSVWRGTRPDFGSFPTRGLFRACRQPVYLAFALTLWTGPVHTLDALLLSMCWTTYCVAAPLHKELRYLSFYGDAFARYRARVPYILPRTRP